jgi:hypothetical protein
VQKKVFDKKNPSLFSNIKRLNKLGIKGTSLTVIKGTYEKSNVTLNSKMKKKNQDISL